VFIFQRAASPYKRPSERSEAASHATSNQGWCSSNCTKRCPTIPVAPRIPTGVFVCIVDLNFTTAFRGTPATTPASYVRSKPGCASEPLENRCLHGIGSALQEI